MESCMHHGNRTSIKAQCMQHSIQKGNQPRRNRWEAGSRSKREQRVRGGGGQKQQMVTIKHEIEQGEVHRQQLIDESKL